MLGGSHIPRGNGSSLPLPQYLNLCISSLGLFLFFSFLFFSFLYLFLAALGLHCCAQAFSSWGEQGYSSLRCAGFSLQWQHRDRTCAPCIGRWILTHWTTREVWLLIFKLQLLSPEECTSPGDTAIPDQCVKWMEQAPTPTSCSKKSV